MKKLISALSIFAFIGLVAIAQDKAPAKDGKTIFTEAKCGACHSVKALEMKGGKSDLSTVGDKIKAEEFKTYLKKETKINEKLHVKKVDLPEEDMKTLTTWLESLKTPEAK